MLVLSARVAKATGKQRHKERAPNQRHCDGEEDGSITPAKHGNISRRVAIGIDIAVWIAAIVTVGEYTTGKGLSASKYNGSVEWLCALNGVRHARVAAIFTKSQNGLDAAMTVAIPEKRRKTQ